jgi:hypothetical protein
MIVTGVRPAAVIVVVIWPVVPSVVVPGTKRTSNSSWPVVPGASGLLNSHVARRVAGSNSARVTSPLPTTMIPSSDAGSGSLWTRMLAQTSLATVPEHSYVRR